MSNERIDIATMEARIRLWQVGDISDEDLALEMDYMVPELKRCYEELDKWTEYATYVENVNMDCHQDACAEAGFLWKCTDCGAHFELPGDGIYKCEFGCDASE